MSADTFDAIPTRFPSSIPDGGEAGARGEPCDSPATPVEFLCTRPFIGLPTCREGPAAQARGSFAAFPRFRCLTLVRGRTASHVRSLSQVAGHPEGSAPPHLLSAAGGGGGRAGPG